MSRIRIWIGLLVCSLLVSHPLRSQDVARPLPELSEFLKETRKNVRFDGALLSQYTFLERETERSLDKNGRVSKTTVTVSEIFPSPDPEDTYVRVIEKDGKAVSAKDLEKQDRERDKITAKYAAESPAQRDKRQAKYAEQRRKDDETIDDLFLAYDITMLGREVVAGSPTIALDLKPRPGFKAKSSRGEIFSKLAGKVWIHETEHEMVKFEATTIDTISFGLGILARIQKGSTLTGQRQKINDEIWLPLIFHADMSARLLLLKGLHRDYTSEYSDFKKFSVDVNISAP